jgi:hypothetical protein
VVKASLGAPFFVSANKEIIMTSTLDIQRRLIALGYDVGPSGADGIPGRSTTRP